MQKQKTTKTVNYNFFASPENLKDIANRSDGIGKALVSNI